MQKPISRKTIIFSDESELGLFGTNGNQEVWRKQIHSLKYTVKHEWHYGLGCISLAGLGNLEIIDGILNAWDMLLYCWIIYWTAQLNYPAPTISSRTMILDIV